MEEIQASCELIVITANRFNSSDLIAGSDDVESVIVRDSFSFMRIANFESASALLLLDLVRWSIVHV